MSLTSCFCTSWKKELVRVLEFRHCSLNFVPEEVYEYEESLEELYLDSNNIRELPRSLFHCEFLKKLGVSDNELCTIPTAVATMVHLEELDISKNGIVELPDNIKCCKNLSLVEISVNPLGRLPEGFTHLINLTQLYLNDTLLDFLPANFGRLIKLKVLELRENHLQSLPKSICRLTELERLDLGQNDFKELPDVVGTLIKLKELWVDYNRLTKLPKSIGNLQDLSYFDASCNRIESLPQEAEGLHSLADLHLSKNYIQELPKNIGKLSHLTTLKMDYNQLSCLPQSMGGLSSLEELILKANDLEDLPPGIGLLRKLRYLNIDQNMLLTIPAELGSCSNITLLSLCGNYLEILPDEIGRIRSLTVLNLSNNKLKYLPYSFTKLNKLKAMWLSDNQANPMLQLQSDILDSGKRVLTCFLFPQQRRDPEDDYILSDEESFHASIWEEQRKERMQIAFNVSESENERKTPKHRTSYPKEGIKQRHRKSQDDMADGRPRLANKMNGQAVLPDYPRVEMGRGSKRDGRLREAKISRPRVSMSPITDSLHLFRADKNKMAKDKLRIRHSSPEKTESEGESAKKAGDFYMPMKSRVLGRREIKANHGRGAMSDTEAATPDRSKTPKGLRRELLEAQSDFEHYTPSDTQSDVGFRLHRRKWQSPVTETQSDFETPVRFKGRLHEGQLNRNSNAATDQRGSQSPAGQRMPRRSGYGTDPEIQRMPRRSGYSTDPEFHSSSGNHGPDRTPNKIIRDDGYVHPRDYYQLPEYAVKNSPARTLNLAQGKGQPGSDAKNSPARTLNLAQGKGQPGSDAKNSPARTLNLAQGKGQSGSDVKGQSGSDVKGQAISNNSSQGQMVSSQQHNYAVDVGPKRQNHADVGAGGPSPNSGRQHNGIFDNETDDTRSRRPAGNDGQMSSPHYKQGPNTMQNQGRPRSGDFDDAKYGSLKDPNVQNSMQYKQASIPTENHGPGRPQTGDRFKSARPGSGEHSYPGRPLSGEQSNHGRPNSGEHSHFGRSEPREQYVLDRPGPRDQSQKPESRGPHSMRPRSEDLGRSAGPGGMSQGPGNHDPSHLGNTRSGHPSKSQDQIKSANEKNHSRRSNGPPVSEEQTSIDNRGLMVYDGERRPPGPDGFGERRPPGPDGYGKLRPPGPDGRHSGVKASGSDKDERGRQQIHHGQRPHNQIAHDYVDMSGPSSAMPASTPIASPKKMPIPSYEEALNRRREITPPRGCPGDKMVQGSSRYPNNNQQGLMQNQHDDYELMSNPNPPIVRTPNLPFARTPNSSPIRTRNYSPSRTQNSSPTRTQNGSPTRTRNQSPTRTQNGSPMRTRNISPTRTQNSSPMRTRNISPTRTQNSSPMRTRNISPTRTQNSSPMRTQNVSSTRTQNGSPMRTRNGSPTRTQNISPTRTQSSMPSKTENDFPGLSQNNSQIRTQNPLPVKHNVNNYTPVSQYHEENNRNLQRVSSNQTSGPIRTPTNQISGPPDSRTLRTPTNLGEFNEENRREYDVERDSGNSSNVTLSENGAPNRMDQNGNDTDSALTESPSPTYSSSGLTPSPQQPHFPQSVGSNSTPDGKVPLLTHHSPYIVAPGVGMRMHRAPPPPYQPKWAARTEGDQKQELSEIPSDFLIDQRPPSPTSTVLAWDTSAIDNEPLPANDNSINTSHVDNNQNPAKTIHLVIYKNPGLGFSITGGLNSPGNPYRPNDMGIFVTKVASSGPADGTLHPGDKILEVNGHNFTNASHDDAVSLLRKSNPVSLVVERD